MPTEIAREPEVPELTKDEIDEITKIVFRIPNPQKADLIFIFGYGPGHTEAHWREVSDLQKDGLSKLVLINGLLDPHSPEPDPPISHIIRDHLVKFGVPKEKILVQDESKNTLEDVILAKKLLDSRNIFPSSILYVAKAHHSGRCYLTLKKYFSDVKLYVYTFNAAYGSTLVSREDWWKYPVARSRVYGEYLRIKKYSERGDIAKLDPK